MCLTRCCHLMVRMRICFHLSGFPPIPGQKATGAEQGFVAALVAADKLASTDNVEIADDDEEEKEEEVGWHHDHLYLFKFLWIKQ